MLTLRASSLVILSGFVLFAKSLAVSPSPSLSKQCLESGTVLQSGTLQAENVTIYTKTVSCPDIILNALAAKSQHVRSLDIERRANPPSCTIPNCACGQQPPASCLTTVDARPTAADCAFLARALDGGVLSAFLVNNGTLNSFVAGTCMFAISNLSGSVLQECWSDFTAVAGGAASRCITSNPDWNAGIAVSASGQFFIEFVGQTPPPS